MNVHMQPGVGIYFVGGPKWARPPSNKLSFLVFPIRFKKIFGCIFENRIFRFLSIVDWIDYVQPKQSVNWSVVANSGAGSLPDLARPRPSGRHRVATGGLRQQS
jgi:hypothetical protein